MRQIDYNAGRYIVLESQPGIDVEIREFQGDLRACTEGELTGSDDSQYSEAKFLQVKRIIDRFRGREGLTEQDRRWRAKVTDVRNWFLFAASERWREDDSEYEHYSDSGGKSGGQKEKLAYTILAASLAYQLLDLLLPSDAIDSSRTGTAQFAARYGFREKPPRIRFRVLDERLAFLPGLSRPDVTLDADSFGRLALPCRHVFITENETNFLAFPDVPESIVLFGAGYGWETLDPARWLTDCALHYWGDIDTHGFAILDQLRCRFPHVGSFLMDRATLMAHEGFWGNEADQVVRDLPRLTAQERELFDDLRDNRIRHGLRLEQERVGFGWVRAALEERVCA